jgi:transposase InsO family protein
MPWKETNTMSLREEFVKAAQEEGANRSELCCAYGISRETGYKWLRRYQAEGITGLRDRSRTPHHSPNKTSPAMEQRILEGRGSHPTWGGRKLKRWLEDQGYEDIPAPSTITEILRRHDQLDPEASLKRQAMQRFEKQTPNELWQMDFKGDFATTSSQRCYPLTVLDDCSRFLVGLTAYGDYTYQTVKQHMTTCFRTYGLPDRMLMDNGSPWGDDRDTPHTVFTTWLLRLGIPTSHGRPRHPQTQGKVERIHRTLQEDVLAGRQFVDLADCQRCFDHWRQVYNYERPLEALDLETPAARYHPSDRPFPETLPPLRFPDGAAIRKTDDQGRFSWQGRRLRAGRAFQHQALGILPDDDRNGLIHVFFNAILIRSFDLTV